MPDPSTPSEPEPLTVAEVLALLDSYHDDEEHPPHPAMVAISYAKMMVERIATPAEPESVRYPRRASRPTEPTEGGEG